MQQSSRDAVTDIVLRLVGKDYAGIEQLTGGRNLSAAELEHAVREYGRELVMPPRDELDIDAVQLAGRLPVAWSVRCDLWSAEEGRSDLTLELSITEDGSGPVVEVDGLHVL